MRPGLANHRPRPPGPSSAALRASAAATRAAPPRRRETLPRACAMMTHGWRACDTSDADPALGSIACGGAQRGARRLRLLGCRRRRSPCADERAARVRHVAHARARDGWLDKPWVRVPRHRRWTERLDDLR